MTRSPIRALCRLAIAALALAATPARANPTGTLIYGPSVTPSVMLPWPGPCLEAAAAMNDGYGPVTIVETDDDWRAITPEQFRSYRLIVIGDPGCGSLSQVIADTARTWGPAINGNVLIIGTDPVEHYLTGGLALIESGIAFAGADPTKTGGYICLSCTYWSAVPGTPFPQLDGFCPSGTCFTGMSSGSDNNVHIVASSPALNGLSDAILSNWQESTHNFFETWPADFIPLAVGAVEGPARPSGPFEYPPYPDQIPPPPPAPSYGFPYIMARGNFAPPACVTPPPNMVLWLPFDEVTGQTAFNAVGGANGSLEGFELSHRLGRVASAISFDVPGEGVVTVPHYPAVILPNTFTVDAWIKPRVHPLGHKYTIADKRSPVGSSWRGFRMYVELDGRLTLEVGDGVCTETFVVPAVPFDTWSHVAAAFNRVTNTGTLWLNGVSTTVAGSCPSIGPVHSTAQLYVGNEAFGPDPGWFLGDIDELEIFDRVLTDSEIGGIVAAGSRGKCKEFAQIRLGSFCDQQAITVPARLFNATPVDQTYTLSFEPLSTSLVCTVSSPIGITQSPPGPISVPANSVSLVTLTIPRPPFVVAGDTACYAVCATNTESGEQACYPASVSWTGFPCWGGPLMTDDVTMFRPRTGVGFNVPIEVSNPTNASLLLDYQILAIGPNRFPDEMVISLNGLPPGTVIPGSLSLAPGESREIDVSAQFVADNPLRWNSIQIRANLGGDGTFIPVQSFPVLNSLIDACPRALDDDLEVFPLGEFCGLGGWEPWTGSTDVCASITTEQAFSGNRSIKVVGNIGGSTGQGDDTVHRFDIVGGHYELDAMTFVPTAATGEAWIVILNTYPQPLNWSLNLRFDAGSGTVRDIDNPSATTPLQKGLWVPVRIDIDLDGDRVNCFYGGVQFEFNKSWRNGSSGNGLPWIQALDLYAGEPGANGTSGTYFDDLVLRQICAEAACYANCDGSTTPPILNVADFTCFLQKFAAGDTYANCDGSTTVPVLNIADFTCFLQKFAQGCQ
jgi:Concanavalin A-like lectin/glucanases superfamily